MSAVGCRWQELCWTDSLAQDPGPGIIQDWAAHQSAAVSVDGAKARVVPPSSEGQPFTWVHLYLQWHGHLWDTARELSPKRSRGGLRPRSQLSVWARRPTHFLRAWRHHPIFTPLLSPPTEGAPTESSGAGLRAPERGAVRKDGGHRWTAAGAVLHQCWPGYHRPVMGPCHRALRGPHSSGLPRKGFCFPQTIPTVPAYNNILLLYRSAPFCLQPITTDESWGNILLPMYTVTVCSQKPRLEGGGRTRCSEWSSETCGAHSTGGTRGWRGRPLKDNCGCRMSSPFCPNTQDQLPLSLPVAQDL